MINWWQRWGGLVQRLVASVGSQASLVGLALVFAPQPIAFTGGVQFLIGVAILLALVSVYLEVRSDLAAHHRLHVYRRSDATGIKAYMRKWIGNSGRAAIWTRDLSWADDAPTMDLLLEKAKGRNLSIFMPRVNETARRLQDAGAEVHAYGGKSLDNPASRFTIAYFGNGGSQVAIGRSVEGKHVIEELGGDDPSFHMATDLVQLARRLTTKGCADE